MGKRNKTSFKDREAHPGWKGGKSLNNNGYVRFNTKGQRDRLEHVVLMEKLLENPVSYMFQPGSKVPKGVDIHHQDGNRRHNCPGNLMLLDRMIHSAISNSYRKYLLYHYDEYLEWLHRDDDGVPF